MKSPHENWHEKLQITIVFVEVVKTVVNFCSQNYIVTAVFPSSEQAACMYTDANISW